MRMPKLYGDLAEWWPLVSPPEDYEKEAMHFEQMIHERSPEARSLLELGSGGGNNASYLKRTFTMTLVDISPAMLAISRRLNPECEHVQGDMRDVRLDRVFDGVFLHDAVLYLTTREDVLQMLRTAYTHCRRDGVLLVIPDFFKEDFRPITSHDGHDRGEKGLRYLEWLYDPDPEDSTFVADLAFLLRTEEGSVRVEHDRHVCGMFTRGEWGEMFARSGFHMETASLPFPGTMPGPCQALVGIRE